MSGIKVKYSTGDVVEHGTIPADTRDGTEIHDFSLEPGERIAALKARAGCLLDKLTFITNKHRVIGPFGGDGGNMYELSVPDQPTAYLAYVKGQVEVSDKDTAVRHVEFVFAY